MQHLKSQQAPATLPVHERVALDMKRRQAKLERLSEQLRVNSEEERILTEKAKREQKKPKITKNQFEQSYKQRLNKVAEAERERKEKAENK